MKILFISRSTLFSQPGGDTLQIEETAYYLNRLGYEVDIKLRGHSFDVSQYDIVHFFNLFRPADLLPYLKDIKKLVITSIYIDYSEYDAAHRGKLFTRLHRKLGKFKIEYLKALARWMNGNDQSTGLSFLLQGQQASISKILKKCDYLITASNKEYEILKNDFPEAAGVPYKKVNLGTEHFISTVNGTPEKSDRIICAARVEGIKNQLNLIKAVNGLPYPVEIFGKASANQEDYWKLCQEIAGPNVKFRGQANKEQLSKAFASSKVHAMPSYYETTGLSTLEALKSGCQVVISDRGAQKEIFEKHAHFCEPSDPESIAAAIEEAMKDNSDHSEWINANFSWSQAARQIAGVYKEILKGE